jgi:ribA/ribD-fused uncharacterized protein
MLDYFTPRHQVHKLLQPPHRIPRTELSNRRAPYAFYHRKRVAGDSYRYRDSFAVFQAFKFMKADPALAERIRMLPTARMAQQEARKQAHRQRSDWLDVNVAVMDKVLTNKFSQHRSLRHMLRDTGSRELIEDSPVRSLSPNRGLPSSSERRSTGSGGLGMMVGDVTSSVKHLCEYESNCKLVKGIDITVAQFSDVFVVESWKYSHVM